MDGLGLLEVRSSSTRGGLGLTLHSGLLRRRWNRLRWWLWRDALEKDLLTLHGLLHLRYLFERRRLRVFFQGVSQYLQQFGKSTETLIPRYDRKRRETYPSVFVVDCRLSLLAVAGLGLPSADGESASVGSSAPGI